MSALGEVDTAPREVISKLKAICVVVQDALE